MSGFLDALDNAADRVTNNVKAQIRAEAAEGVKPYVLLAVGLSLLALYQSSSRRR